MKFNPKPFRLCFRILAFITPFAFLLRLFTYWFEVESATGFFKGQGLSCTLYNVLGFIVFAICFAFVALTKSPVPTPENKLVPEEDFPEEYSDEVSAEYAEEYSDEAPAEYAEEYSQEAPAEYAEEYSQEAPVEYAEEYSQEAPAEYAEEYSQESTEAECALLAGGAPAQSFSLEEGAFPREENEALSPEEALEEEPEFLSSVMESGAEPKDRGSHRTVRHRSRRKVELLPDFCILCTTWQGTLSAFVTFLTGFAFFAYSLSFLTDPAMILDPYRQAFSLLSFLSGAYFLFAGLKSSRRKRKLLPFFALIPSLWCTVRMVIEYRDLARFINKSLYIGQFLFIISALIYLMYHAQMHLGEKIMTVPNKYLFSALATAFFGVSARLPQIIGAAFGRISMDLVDCAALFIDLAITCFVLVKLRVFLSKKNDIF